MAAARTTYPRNTHAVPPILLDKCSPLNCTPTLERLRYVAMNFVENFNALFDHSFFVFLDTKFFEQAIPRGAHGLLTSLCLYLPKVFQELIFNCRVSLSLLLFCERYLNASFVAQI